MTQKTSDSRTASYHGAPLPVAWQLLGSHVDSLRRSFETSRLVLEFLHKMLCNAAIANNLISLNYRIDTFHTTLQFRLDTLRIDCPAAWYRSVSLDHAGPFQTKILVYPVFSHNAELPWEQVQNDLARRWRAGATLDNIKDKLPSLWQELLAINALLASVSESSRTVGIDFEQKVHRSESSISPDLDPIINEAREIFISIRRKCDLAFETLMAKCFQFWKISRNQQRSQTEAERIRAEFSKKRQHGATSKQSPLHGSLQYLGFRELPAADELKSRYLTLAKRYHPDRPGGKEESFKKLSESYRCVVKALKASKQPSSSRA